MNQDDNAQLAQAWDQFCDKLKEAKSVVFRDSAPAQTQDRSAGIRMLARNISMALDKEFENADPLHPELTHIMDWRRKQGGDNPDSLYLTAPIDGVHTYRLSGTRGSVKFIAITVCESGNSPWGGPAIGKLFNHTMDVNDDGTFEIIISPEASEPQAKNWMKTTPKTHRLYIRQFFYDWENEEPMQVRIDRLGDAINPPDITLESVSEGLLKSAQWLNDITRYWTDCLEMWQKRPLEFLSFNQMMNNALDATPGGEPLICYWHMAKDEALIIRATPPEDTAFWNLELGDWWFESMDYRYRLANTNGHYAQLEETGEVIVAVTHDDPGLPNWLDASGYAAGYLCCRWIGSATAPQPSIERVKRADLLKHLPKAVKRIDAVERQRQLAERRRGIVRRFSGF